MTFASALVTLFFIMDPLGNVPLFISILNDVPKERRLPILVREIFIALAVMILFLFFGARFLSLISVDQTALSVAGGVVLFIIALKMIFPEPKKDLPSDHIAGEPFIVPLAVPLFAGPSTVSILILMAMQNPNKMSVWLGAMVCAWLLSSIILLSGYKISKFLGERAMTAATRLMGMILTAVSVQMLMTGLSEFLKK